MSWFIKMWRKHYTVFCEQKEYQHCLKEPFVVLWLSHRYLLSLKQFTILE
ncbi:unnamed protein product [Strongylus vulgaris]|uniref:Uncharacterized protein n=1 Tax=Strongylus vulgaris TaxID=40348 RepID=A0A3P7JTK1_STRVU|nr:unnamed protein product [Strongylus vulgaris]